jgi:hypothetical protein
MKRLYDISCRCLILYLLPWIYGVGCGQSHVTVNWEIPLVPGVTRRISALFRAPCWQLGRAWPRAPFAFQGCWVPTKRCKYLCSCAWIHWFYMFWQKNGPRGGYKELLTEGTCKKYRYVIFWRVKFCYVLNCRQFTVNQLNLRAEPIQFTGQPATIVKIPPPVRTC